MTVHTRKCAFSGDSKWQPGGDCSSLWSPAVIERTAKGTVKAWQAVSQSLSPRHRCAQVRHWLGKRLLFFPRGGHVSKAFSMIKERPEQGRRGHSVKLSVGFRKMRPGSEDPSKVMESLPVPGLELNFPDMVQWKINIV